MVIVEHPIITGLALSSAPQAVDFTAVALAGFALAVNLKMRLHLSLLR
jgi:hypothetical protein